MPRFFSSANVAISLPRYKDLQTFGRYQKVLRERFRNLQDANGWVSLNVDTPVTKKFDFTAAHGKPPSEPDAALAELHLDSDVWTTKEVSEVGRLWHDVIGNTVIPFDVKERQQVLAHSFQKLEQYVQKQHEEERKSAYEA